MEFQFSSVSMEFCRIIRRLAVGKCCWCGSLWQVMVNLSNYNVIAECSHQVIDGLPCLMLAKLTNSYKLTALARHHSLSFGSLLVYVQGPSSFLSFLIFLKLVTQPIKLPFVLSFGANDYHLGF
jgi:hypothetical protein